MWNEDADSDLVAGMDELRKIKPKRSKDNRTKFDRVPQISPFYTLEDLVDITGFSKSKIYSMSNDGDIPKQRKVGSRSIRWIKSEIDAWLKNIINS